MEAPKMQATTLGAGPALQDEAYIEALKKNVTINDGTGAVHEAIDDGENHRLRPRSGLGEHLLMLDNSMPTSPKVMRGKCLPRDKLLAEELCGVAPSSTPDARSE